MLQVSNLCFDFGQITYKRVMATAPDVSDRSVFAWLYLGAVVAAGMPAMFTTDLSAIDPSGPQ